MMQASAYGRLGQEPRAIGTKSGKAMATCTLAVDASDSREDDSQPLWLGLVAFGRTAEDLLRHAKGDLLSVSGRVQRNSWTDRGSGQTREQLQIVCDAIVSARTARPAGGHRKSAASENARSNPPESLNDEIPF